MGLLLAPDTSEEFSVEKAYIDEAIRVYGDTTEGKQKAADALGIGIATLYRKLKE